MLSFNGNKIVTTGNGGAVITNDSAVATSCKHLSTTAKLKHQWRFDHDQVGWNYRLPNLNAALGVAQLRRLDDIRRRKRRLHDKYVVEFKHNPSVTVLSERSGTQSNYWLNTIQISNITLQERETLLAHLHREGYLCRPAWTLLHKLPMYSSAPRGKLSEAEVLENELISLPSGPRLCT
jgi:perosamine synthetase